MENWTPPDLASKETIYRILKAADGSVRYCRVDSEISSAAMKRTVDADIPTYMDAVPGKSPNRKELIPAQIRKDEYVFERDPALIGSSEVEHANPASNPSQTGTLRAFGMFWQRSQVHWLGKPRLLGRQRPGPADVNFAQQVGIYLLHDRDRIIYVGRAADTLYARLKIHTTDRLAGRWDRFSWFGLRSVRADGTMLMPSSAWTHNVVMEVMEALLIESLEPPLNRKRGDNLSAVEYLQVPDPGIELSRKKQLLAELMKTAGWDDI